METGSSGTRGRATGIVLAGGRSVRMGRDKGSIVLDGRPMLSIAIDLVASVADEVIVSCRSDVNIEPLPHVPRPVRLVHDGRAGGPLAGLEASLAAARYELAVVVPVDMPWLEQAALEELCATARARPGASAVVFASESGPVPLPAVYRRSVLPFVSAQLDAGDLRLGNLLRRLQPLMLPLDPARADRILANVNEPADLRRLRG